MSEKFKIERLSWQGDGVTTVRNEDVFVPFSLPGEIAEGDIANGICENMRILEPVSERVKAPCRHFKKCGGCILQHADDALLADWKMKLVQDTLVRILEYFTTHSDNTLPLILAYFTTQ